MSESFPVKWCGVDCNLRLNDDNATKLKTGETVTIKLWDTLTLSQEDA